jgi:tetratricopeptide (TPR) repeat protein
MDTTYEYGSQQAAEPFWQRIRKFSLLPLDKAVLLRIFALSGALLVSLVLPFLGGLGLALLAAVVFALLVVGASYGFKIIERSSKGYLIPSDYGLTDQTAVGPLLPYKFAALIVAFAAVAVILNRMLGAFDLAALIVLGVVFAALLPAVSIRLVTTGSLRGALNLAEIFGAVRKIGRPYAALSGFVFGGVVGGLGALYVLGVLGHGGADPAKGGLGYALLTLLFSVAFWYYAFAVCAVLGYALFQHADAFHIALLARDGKRLKSSTGRHADVKARTRDALIGQMLTQGEIREAIELLNADLSQRPNDLSLHARLHKLLLAENYAPRVEDHTEKYVALLVKSQNWHEALELVEEALARRADWAPRRTESIAPLARAALQKGRPQLAATLIRGFDKKHPNHPDIPQIYFVGAQLMAESGRKPDEARRILQYLLQKYGGDSVAAEARRYLDVLDRLATQPH